MTPLKIVVIRQRPAFGDALLLQPLLKALREKHPTGHITVVTDPNYLGGALPLMFESMPEIDRVEYIPSLEWTTEENKIVDPILYAAGKDTPYTVTKADILLDCNAAFIQFERQYNSRNPPPCGIAEFWLRHFGFYTPETDLLPHYTVSDSCKEAVNEWKSSNRITKPMIGIVLRAGDVIRDWDFNGLSTQIADWLHTSGYTPIGIDPVKTLPSIYGYSCVGKKLDYVAALLEQCHLVLTPDTGLLHLAQAVGTRTIALWGIMEPRLRVEGYNCKVVPEHSLGYCSNDRKSCITCKKSNQQWSCLRRIKLPMIIKALEESL